MVQRRAAPFRGASCARQCQHPLGALLFVCCGDSAHTRGMAGRNAPRAAAGRSGFLGLCGTMDDRAVEQGTLDGDERMTLTKKVAT